MKSKIYIPVLVALLLISGSLNAKNLGTLNDLLTPIALEIGHGHVYCMQETTIYSYDIMSLKLLNQFCKKGEGPGEMKLNSGLPNFFVALKNSLLLVGIDKAIAYSPAGKIKKEFKLPPLGANYLHPLDDSRYMGIKFRIPPAGARASVSAGIMDRELNIEKELYKQEFSGGQNLVDLTPDGIFIAVADNKIFIDQSMTENGIAMYDFSGNLIKKIELNVTPEKFSSVHRERAMERIRQNSAIRSIGWENFKKAVKFQNSDTVPVIQDMQVADGLIYIMTARIKQDKQEFLVIDQAGKTVKTLYLPAPVYSDLLSTAFSRPNRMYKFFQGKYYYLRENEDDETWELHAEKL